MMLSLSRKGVCVAEEWRRQGEGTGTECSCWRGLGFASDLDTAQRILLQNFNTPTETVFFQNPRFFGGLRHSQKEENHAAECLHLQEPMKMSIEYGILCVQIIG
ncbi:hypothetical protein NQ318_022695 [Aromia moschata]|uniref:Uncharacterized protein n=1 Tax=Aromia moschata TaxID=1265417 RepID=A0AAV8YB29_9CUCU|nr:hypothetical protein NQ318_022695 [Aromia moschata]